MEKLLHKIDKGLSALFLLFLMLAFNAPLFCSLTILCVIIHEGGHYIALWILKKKTGRVHPRLSGLMLPYQGTLSYREEIFVAAMGPLFNIGSAFICLCLLPLGRAFFLSFAILHILYALSNLLPLPSYDGEKILGALLSYYFGDTLRERVIYILSFILRCMFLFLSLYFIFFFNVAYHIFAVFFLSFLPIFSDGLKREKVIEKQRKNE